MKEELKEGKDQRIFDERLKNNPLRTIRHGLDDVDAHCRICTFSVYGKSEVSKKAKVHAQKTGHTIDIYRTHWTELTYYKKSLLPLK